MNSNVILFLAVLAGGIGGPAAPPSGPSATLRPQWPHRRSFRAGADLTLPQG